MEFAGFGWDEANQYKSQKHGVSIPEIESLFGGSVVILPDADHSQMKVRPISARYMHRREASNYEETYPEL
jgi:hypothetical protein